MEIEYVWSTPIPVGFLGDVEAAIRKDIEDDQ